MWAVIHHNPYDSSGGVGAALDRHGLAAVHLRPYLGDSIPAVATLSGVVVLGGPAGAADDETPHLCAERSLLADAAHAGLPVLGVCFGAQLLAVALGGDVGRAERPAIGMTDLRPTRDGVRDPVLGRAGDRLRALSWRHDQHDPPPGSVPLARNAADDQQAFRWRTRTYGLQFHVELDADLAETIRPQIPHVALTREDVDDVAAVGRRVLDAFFGPRRA